MRDTYSRRHHVSRIGITDMFNGWCDSWDRWNRGQTTKMKVLVAYSRFQKSVREGCRKHTKDDDKRKFIIESQNKCAAIPETLRSKHNPLAGPTGRTQDVDPKETTPALGTPQAHEAL